MPLKIKAFTKSFRADTGTGEHQPPAYDPIPSQGSRILWAAMTSFWATVVLRDQNDWLNGWAEPIGTVAILALVADAWVSAFLPRETLLKWRRPHIALVFALLAVWVLAMLA